MRKVRYYREYTVTTVHQMNILVMNVINQDPPEYLILAVHLVATIYPKNTETSISKVSEQVAVGKNMKNTDQQLRKGITRATSHRQTGTKGLAVKGSHVTVPIIHRGLASSRRDCLVDLGLVMDFREHQKAQIKITELKVDLV